MFFVYSNMIKDKKGLEIEMIGWWVIGLAILAVVVIGLIILKAKGISAIDYLQNLLRFGK